MPSPHDGGRQLPTPQAPVAQSEASEQAAPSGQGSQVAPPQSVALSS